MNFNDYEYWQTHKFGGEPAEEKDYEEALHDAIVDYMDVIDGGDFMDFAYSGNQEEFKASLETIKKMAQAAYDGNDQDLLVFAKSLTKRMIDNISDYVEREKM